MMARANAIASAPAQAFALTVPEGAGWSAPRAVTALRAAWEGE